MAPLAGRLTSLKAARRSPPWLPRTGDGARRRGRSPTPLNRRVLPRPRRAPLNPGRGPPPPVRSSTLTTTATRCSARSTRDRWRRRGTRSSFRRTDAIVCGRRRTRRSQRRRGWNPSSSRPERSGSTRWTRTARRAQLCAICSERSSHLREELATGRARRDADAAELDKARALILNARDAREAAERDARDARDEAAAARDAASRAATELTQSESAVAKTSREFEAAAVAELAALKERIGTLTSQTAEANARAERSSPTSTSARTAGGG